MDSLVFVHIVPLWNEDKEWHKFRVSEQCLNTLYNVVKVDIEGLPSNNNLFTLEAWPTRYFFVNNFIKLV